MLMGQMQSGICPIISVSQKLRAVIIPLSRSTGILIRKRCDNENEHSGVKMLGWNEKKRYNNYCMMFPADEGIDIQEVGYERK